MTRQTKFTLAQINPKVGDLDGNLRKVIDHCDLARAANADAVIFPELAISGYPPEDLLLRRDFLARCENHLATLKSQVKGIDIVIGHPLVAQVDGQEKAPHKIYNAVSVLRDGKTRALYRKRHLPNYAVFDERRYFAAGSEPCVVDLGGVKVGLAICEDIWQAGPIAQSAALGAQLIIAVNASPFHNEQAFLREEGVVRKNARASKLPMIYLNQVGGQDELVFDGSSLAVDASGEVVARLPAFIEAVETLTFADGKFDKGKVAPRLQGAELIYRAIVLGVRDYIDKNNFGGAVLGLSGGIDSALTLAIAVDAIGKSRVSAVMMPSRHTSKMSIEDAQSQAEKLGVKFEIISIEPIYQAALAQLAPRFDAAAVDVAEQNIQARCRAMLLMAISNKFGQIVLTTGNKSEMAVGYATLYGDMAGGFSAIKDVPKMMVYELARHRNQRPDQPIPPRVITRAPSAELAPDQIDADSLPLYDILDPILELFIEQDKSADEIIAAGFAHEVVHRVIDMVIANEYKRRQSAPGVRVTSRAFGKDRRYPITSGFCPSGFAPSESA